MKRLTRKQLKFFMLIVNNAYVLSYYFMVEEHNHLTIRFTLALGAIMNTMFFLMYKITKDQLR